MATSIPLTLNYVVDETTPELEDPLLRTDVKKQLSKAAIRVNNQRNFLDKKTYNAYVVQSFDATTPAVHGTTIANIFEKIAALFPTNGGTSDIPVQCKAIVPDLHDSVIPIPDIIDNPSIITNGPYQKFLNMVPIFYAPPGQLLEVPGVGSIIEVEFNDNNYNEGRIIRVIKSTVVNPAPAPSFPTPFVPSSGPQPQLGTPLPSPPSGAGPQAVKNGVRLGTGACTASNTKNTKDPSFNCCPPSSYPAIPTGVYESTKGITLQQRVESIQKIGQQRGYPRWVQLQAMAVSLQEQSNQGPNFNMAGIQLDVGSWPPAAMQYVSVQTCIRDSQKWRIFAGFNSLDDFSNFMLIVIANKFNNNSMSSLETLTPGTPEFAETVMDNWVRSWLYSLKSNELAIIKSGGMAKGVTKNLGPYKNSFQSNIKKILPYFKN